MLRISSGSLKNTKLTSPEFEGFRAVQEVAKQCVFAVLSDNILSAKCLDLYAGSGNLGLEAISRGALNCDFVDESYISKTTIMENISKCNVEDKTNVFQLSAVKFISKAAKSGAKYDVVFIDPFYEDVSHKFLIKTLPEILNPKAKVVFLHGTNLNMSQLIDDSQFTLTTERRFGMCVVSFLDLK
jgi:16S rRNA (guanine(966)-N(2))-methyltransferase RsmD